MARRADRAWFPAAVLLGFVYVVVGVAFGAIANPSSSGQWRVAWRLAAWLVCAVAFAVHLGFEHFRLRNSPRQSALHVSVAVALGAFALAVWVNVHAHLTASNRQSRLAPLALVVFPAVTAIPAFLVALAVAAALRGPRRHD